MRRTLYITYSAQLPNGHLTGRSQISVEQPASVNLLTKEQLASIEATALASCREGQPDATNLYLTNWIWLLD